MKLSQAHAGEIFPVFIFADKYKDGTTWSARDGAQHCDYCGSLHPTEVVALLKAGARISMADWKYGWPHKAYLDSPWGKFYTRHLQDATPEEADYICRRLGMTITFSPDGKEAAWGPYEPPKEPS